MDSLNGLLLNKVDAQQLEILKKNEHFDDELISYMRSNLKVVFPRVVASLTSKNAVVRQVAILFLKPLKLVIETTPSLKEATHEPWWTNVEQDIERNLCAKITLLQENSSWTEVWSFALYVVAFAHGHRNKSATNALLSCISRVIRSKKAELVEEGYFCWSTFISFTSAPTDSEILFDLIKQPLMAPAMALNKLKAWVLLVEKTSDDSNIYQSLIHPFLDSAFFGKKRSFLATRYPNDVAAALSRLLANHNVRSYFKEEHLVQYFSQLIRVKTNEEKILELLTSFINFNGKNDIAVSCLAEYLTSLKEVSLTVEKDMQTVIMQLISSELPEGYDSDAWRSIFDECRRLDFRSVLQCFNGIFPFSISSKSSSESSSMSRVTVPEEEKENCVPTNSRSVNVTAEEMVQVSPLPGPSSRISVSSEAEESTEPESPPKKRLQSDKPAEVSNSSNLGQELRSPPRRRRNALLPEWPVETRRASCRRSLNVPEKQSESTDNQEHSTTDEPTMSPVKTRKRKLKSKVNVTIPASNLDQWLQKRNSDESPSAKDGSCILIREEVSENGVDVWLEEDDDLQLAISSPNSRKKKRKEVVEPETDSVIPEIKLTTVTGSQESLCSAGGVEDDIPSSVITVTSTPMSSDNEDEQPPTSNDSRTASVSPKLPYRGFPSFINSRSAQMVRLAASEESIREVIVKKKRKNITPLYSNNFVRKNELNTVEPWVACEPNSPCATPSRSLLRSSPSAMTKSSGRKKVCFLQPPVSKGLLFDLSPGPSGFVHLPSPKITVDNSSVTDSENSPIPVNELESAANASVEELGDEPAPNSDVAEARECNVDLLGDSPCQTPPDICTDVAASPPEITPSLLDEMKSCITEFSVEIDQKFTSLEAKNSHLVNDLKMFKEEIKDELNSFKDELRKMITDGFKIRYKLVPE